MLLKNLGFHFKVTFFLDVSRAYNEAFGTMQRMAVHYALPAEQRSGTPLTSLPDKVCVFRAFR